MTYSVSVAIGELLLSFFLFTSLFRKQSLWVAVVLFSIFTVVSIWKSLTGVSECGCFGRFTLSPLQSLMINIGCLSVLGLLAKRSSLRSETRGVISPNRQIFDRSNIVQVLYYSLCAGICLAPLLFLAFIPDATIAYNLVDLRNQSNPVGVVILDFGAWIGKSFGLTELIADCPNTLENGTWTVVFYSNRCSSCDRVLNELLETEPRKSSQVLLISVNGIDAAAKKIDKEHHGSLHYGYLQDPKKYFVDTPTVLFLEDGIVVDTKTPKL
jgi:hypothetical protein